MFNLFKKKPEKDLVKVFEPKQSLKNFVVKLYEDRLEIIPYMTAPSIIYLKDITGFSTQATGLTKSIIYIYGNGTELFAYKQFADWNQEFIDFLRENVSISKDDEQSNSGSVKQLTLDDLPKFKQLLDAGVITQEDFDAAKKKLLY